MSTKTRRIVDAIDDLIAELRVANEIEALRLGAAALDIDEGKRATTPNALARVARANKLRAGIRAGLNLEEGN